VRTSYFERVATIWTVHPALAMLGTSDARRTGAPAGPAKSERELQMRKIAAGNATLRTLLSTAPTRVRSLQKLCVAVEDNSPGTHRDRLAEAARIVRSTAAFGAPAPDRDPVEELHLFELQQLFLWHATRASRDCWSVSNTSGQPFFQQAGAGYVATAGVAGPLPATLQQQAAEVQSELAQHRRAVGSAISLQAGNILLLGKQQLPETVVRIEQHAGARLPSGLATVMASNHAGDAVPGITANGGTAPGDAGLLEIIPGREDRVTLSGTSLAGHGPQLNAAAWFRGAVFSSPFMVQTLGGVRIDYQPHRYNGYSVTLSGDQQRKLSVVFILDVSHSMSALTEVETTDGEKMSRLNVATNALLGMLNQLAQRTGARVGVRFYGHRTGWTSSKDKPVVVLRQTDYGRDIPLNLSPAADVERVLPLGRFDAAHASQVEKLAATLKPWGQTPLYLAIAGAQRDFAREPAAHDRRIVVITDGLNFQLTPAAAGKFEPAPASSIDTIRAAFDAYKAPVHIVGFKLPPGDVEQARRDFGKIARNTGGSYTPVDRGGQLIASLAALLGRGLYTVRNANGDPLVSTSGVQEMELGESFAQASVAAPQNLTVDFESSRLPVQIQGGEALRLIARGSGQIESARYDTRLPRFFPLMWPSGAPSGYHFGIHRPGRNGPAGAGFMFSVQHANMQFTPRPAGMWIEAEPLTSDGRTAGPKYVFYDVNYEPGKPVPVLNWNASSWPAAATAARVNCWASPQAVAPVLRLPLATVLKSGQQNSVDHVLDDPAGASLQISAQGGLQGEPLKVTVVQRHSGASPDVYAMKIDIRPGPLSAPGDMQPRRVHRRFDPQHGVATHVFEFDATARSAVSSMMVDVTTHAAIAKNAWRLHESVLVDVAGKQGLLKLETARGGQSAPATPRR